jgi:phosphoenolpyruvate carboxykinase (GTP)
MGSKLSNPPKIFNVNWFRKDKNGHFLWPGFGDNLRALLWALERCEGTADAVETPLGFIPNKEALDLEGLKITDKELEQLLTVDNEAWRKELEGIKGWYNKFDHMPKELLEYLSQLEYDLGLVEDSELKKELA